ncbi:MAG: nitroreductase [Clostridia bacterium]|nr:nitroreductase [Clostridia bacterium]
MELREMIYKRKSVRSYTDERVDEATLHKIRDFSCGLKHLYSDIKVHSEIVGRESIRCILPWTTPQLIAIFSEEKEGYLENVGFMFQQLDLYLQSLGIGVCWLGMGRPGKEMVKSKDGMKFVMLLAFGHPKGDALRGDVSEFKRHSLSDISDKEDARLEPARLAPSSVNSQPWYFTHEGEAIHLYCAMKGLLKVKMLTDMNRIDVGIALAHIYVANPLTFGFYKANEVKNVNGYGYIGSFTV